MRTNCPVGVCGWPAPESGFDREGNPQHLPPRYLLRDGRSTLLPARGLFVGSAMRLLECPRDCRDEWQGRTSRAMLPAPYRSKPRFLPRRGFRQRIFLVLVMRLPGPRRDSVEQADG